MEKRVNLIKAMFKELIQPFADLFHTSRALLGVNLSYIIEGITYFGVLGLLTLFFQENIGLTDETSGKMVGALTGGITLAMLLLGATVDFIGVRKAFLYSLVFMLFGRIILAIAPLTGTTGIWSLAQIVSLLGLFGIVLGYGIYQPAAYAAVKKFTSKKTSAMGYAMLYALMNLGGFLPGIISPPVRRAYGITGIFWVYIALTIVGFLLVFFILTKKAEKEATVHANSDDSEPVSAEDNLIDNLKGKDKLAYYFKNFPLKDLRFLFFIFILIPVQTLFAHNWLTLPAYTSRAFSGFVSNNFEFFVNLNPILIFVLTPAVAALTAKKNPYSMMIAGTLVMSMPAFVLTLGPSINTLVTYLIIMTIGEAMWYPRFMQWVADLAPRGMTGIYMGIGQFPWFLTKVVTSFYSGWFLTKYCPPNTPPQFMNTEYMWLIYGLITLITPIGLILARKWMLKGFKKNIME